MKTENQTAVQTKTKTENGAVKCPKCDKTWPNEMSARMHYRRKHTPWNPTKALRRNKLFADRAVGEPTKVVNHRKKKSESQPGRNLQFCPHCGVDLRVYFAVQELL